ncbi:MULTISPECIES: acyl-[acyl-carrier-protein] thioesterase [Loigolactobacillus]|uniref:acyl-[acyl-carrier-protein] thioesterase n=1 Tax=Loigolactobacillus TaxID=2767889 RepID=UPI000F7F7954|nr:MULTISPECIES: acyl-ACP thioesterase domain-containing protein [Loigolactobacillus]MDA5388280.1 thioesterase [Loigolactobacillus backii]MDA5390774.1 thioesterase [Loigolactobacillus backii]
MGIKYTEDHRVTYYEGDTKDQMTLAMLINVAILVSEHQNDALGIGNDYIHEFGAGWVVTQYSLEIKRMPRVDETVTFGTEATGFNKYFCYRDYWAQDAAGNRLATIHSIWVLMSYETRKMIAVIPEIVTKYETASVKGVKHFPRISRIDAGKEVATQNYRVRYFDIDGNQHVNNAHYFDWMFDHLGFDFCNEHDIATVNIRYEREVKYGELPESRYQFAATTDAGLVTSRHQIINNGKRCAEAEVVWTKHEAK